MNSLTDIKSVVIHIAGALCFVCLAAVIAISCYGGFLFWCTIPKKTSIDKIKLDNQTITVW
jgi:hypothetical protein